jgi:hypothetical protein
VWGLVILAATSLLQVLNELQQNMMVEGLEEVRLIKDKRTGMYCAIVFRLISIKMF